MRKILLTLSLLMATNTFARQSVSEVVDNVLTPTSLVTQLMFITCYIVGLILMFTAVAQYRVHRHSPKLVPLTTPILILVMGILTVLIPFGTKFFQTGSVAEYYKQDDKPGLNLPPLTPHHDNRLPTYAPVQSQQPSPYQNPPTQQQQPQQPAAPSHWTDQRTYQ